MHISEIYGDDMPQIDGFEFACDERVNLFIGPNASGKSTILRAIEGLHTLALTEPITSNRLDVKGIVRISGFHGNLDYIDPIDYPSPGGGLSFGLQVSDDWPRDDAGTPDLKQVPFLYIPAIRLGLPGSPVFEPNTIVQIAEDPLDLQDVLDEKANPHLKHLLDTGSGVFSGQYVELAIDWLRKGMIGDRMQQQQLRQALTVGYWCAQSVCSEVVRDYSPHPFVERFEMADSQRIVHQEMGIGTSDRHWNTEQPLYAGSLSSGTQGTLLWIYALVLKMVDHYGLPAFDWSDDWSSNPAILLIDEIENHLHPTWQRRVIPELLRHFPGLQIFATTHSPFVVAGLEAGQVHLLRRDGPPTTNTEDIVGWTADEILRNMMSVEDPTDDDTAAAARELRELRDEWPLDDPDAEAERQERMLELRQKVDRDLLEGGPWAAQRAQFEEQFADALEKYRQSKDLGQENG